MERVSVIIPSRKERYLDKTINDIFNKFGGEYEVIVTLDGYNDKRAGSVKYIHNKEPRGMRTAINQAVGMATGKYIMKLDAHCMVDEGIDLKLIENHHENWVQIPRRKRLDARRWELIDNGKPDVDYMYLNKHMVGIADNVKNRNGKLKTVLIDDTETFQGSCYFMAREYFDKLGLLDAVNFSGSGNEAQEITFRVLSDGGRVVRNKKTWYAHARNGRYYSTDRSKSREYIKKVASDYREGKGFQEIGPCQ